MVPSRTLLRQRPAEQQKDGVYLAILVRQVRLEGSWLTTTCQSSPIIAASWLPVKI